jgi:DNA-directed RNA polymerase specialized sigma24 family protein
MPQSRKARVAALTLLEPFDPYPDDSVRLKTVGDFLALACGNPGATALLYQYSGHLTPTVCRRQGIPPDLAQDLQGELYERAARDDWAAVRRANPRTPFYAWLRAFLNNIARETRRRERETQGAAAVLHVGPRRNDPGADGGHAEAPSPPDDAEFAQAKGLLDRMTPQLWAVLTEKQATALRECAGNTALADAARSLNRSRGAIRDRLKRGAERLRAELEGRCRPDVRKPLPAAPPRRGPPLTSEQELVRRLWNEGVALRRIAEQTGRDIAPEGIRSIVRRLRDHLE